jgi:hypothetical protein
VYGINAVRLDVDREKVGEITSMKVDEFGIIFDYKDSFFVSWGLCMRGHPLRSLKWGTFHVVPAILFSLSRTNNSSESSFSRESKTKTITCQPAAQADDSIFRNLSQLLKLTGVVIRILTKYLISDGFEVE